MKRLLTTLAPILLISITLNAQQENVGVGTNTPKAKLHVQGDMVAVDTLDEISAIDPPVSGAGTRMMWYGDKAAFRVGHLDALGSSYWNKSNIGFYSVSMGLNAQASGFSSLALGNHANASSSHSVAIGDSAIASGVSSIALGFDSNASGDFSFAVGQRANATGLGGIALGLEVTAAAFGSVAIGQFNTATGNPNFWNTNDPIFEIGIGNNSSLRANAFTVYKNGSSLFGGEINNSSPDDPPTSGAGVRMMWYPEKAAFRAGIVTGPHWDKGNIGNSSVAIGSSTKANGGASAAFGERTVASGAASLATGLESIASGSVSTAMGYLTEASGTNSMALGEKTIASNDNSIAIGYSTTASGSNSFAAGDRSTSSGLASMSLGSSTVASGNYSLTSGINSVASGASSSSFGYETDANAYASFAIGRFNSGGGNASSWISSDPLFEIGIGTSASSRANAFTVLKGGNVGIGTNSPASVMHIDGTDPRIRLEGSSGNVAVEYYNNSTFGSSIGHNITSEYLFLYNNGNVVVKDGNLGVGTFTPEAGIDIRKNIFMRLQHNLDVDYWLFDMDVATTGVGNLNLYFNNVKKSYINSGDGSWNQVSDKKLKTQIEYWKHPILDNILKLKPANYKYYDNDSTISGFIAQDVREVFPDLVNMGENGLLGLNYSGFSVYSIKAIQELAESINLLDSENRSIKMENNNLKIILQDLLLRMEALEATLKQ